MWLGVKASSSHLQPPNHMNIWATTASWLLFSANPPVVRRRSCGGRPRLTVLTVPVQADHRLPFSQTAGWIAVDHEGGCPGGIDYEAHAIAGLLYLEPSRIRPDWIRNHTGEIAPINYWPFVSCPLDHWHTPSAPCSIGIGIGIPMSCTLNGPTIADIELPSQKARNLLERLWPGSVTSVRG